MARVIMSKLKSWLNSFIFFNKIEGFKAAAKRTMNYVLFRKAVYDKSEIINYNKWLKINERWDLKKIRREIKAFPFQLKISIITPVYNVEPKWLDKCIRSVLNQFYDNWELCLYDDASTHKETRECLRRWGGRDERIKISHGKKNLHISGASNQALKLATGDYIALLDNDDELAPNALYEVVKLINKYPQADFIYSDEDKIEEDGRQVEPFFKPDWNRHLFLSMMYTCHLGVYRKKIIDKIGGFRQGYEGSQDYDLVLRFIEQIDEKNIFHIPKILYHWRKLPTSTAKMISAKNYAYVAAKKAIQDYLERSNIKGIVKDGVTEGYYKVERKIIKPEKVSIILPVGKIRILEKVLKNIFNRTKYNNYEIILISNGELRDKIETFIKEPNKKKVKIINFNSNNLAESKNYAAKFSSGKFLLFLGANIIDVNKDWLNELVAVAQDKKVGIVGAKILYPNKKIYHAGLILDFKNIKNFVFKDMPEKRIGYLFFHKVIRGYSAVSGECLFIKKNIFNELGGFNQANLPLYYNDVDLCLRTIKKGYEVVYNSYAELKCSNKVKKREDTELVELEKKYMRHKWKKFLDSDPNYNINLTFRKKAAFFDVSPTKINYF